MARPKPIEIARIIEEERQHLEHEDEAHRLMGIDLGNDDIEYEQLSMDGKVIISGRDND